MTKRASGQSPAAATTHDKPKTEPGGKLGLIIELLRRPEGADLSAMMEATGWQQHSVRGAMAGALKRKAGLQITSEKGAGPRIYRIAEPIEVPPHASPARRRAATAADGEVGHG